MTKLILFSFFGIYLTQTFGIEASITQQDTRKTISMAEHQLRYQMDELWVEYGNLLRNYLIEAMNNSPETKQLADKLTQNTQSIGTFFVDYYGAKAGSRITNFLQNIQPTINKVITATKQNDTASIARQINLSHANADDFARYLYTINPNLIFNVSQKMFYTFVQTVTNEINARSKKDWANDISYYEIMIDQAGKIAENFSTAIVKQFPAKFK